MERDRQNFLSFWTILCHFIVPLMIPKIKILKKMKKMPGDIIILLYIHVYHKLKSYIYGAWNIRYHRQNFLSFWAIFYPFSPLTSWKMKILKLRKKTWTYHFTHLHHKWQSCDVWFLRYEVWRTGFVVILDHFLPFYPLTTQKLKILTKWKKHPGDIIILHMCNINDNHMMYGSWDMERDRQNSLSFWTIFCCFTSLKNQKFKFSKNKKNAWRYYHFIKVYQKSWSYAIVFLRHGAWQM